MTKDNLRESSFGLIVPEGEMSVTTERVCQQEQEAQRSHLNSSPRNERKNWAEGKAISSQSFFLVMCFLH